MMTKRCPPQKRRTKEIKGDSFEEAPNFGVSLTSASEGSSHPSHPLETECLASKETDPHASLSCFGAGGCFAELLQTMFPKTGSFPEPGLGHFLPTEHQQVQAIREEKKKSKKNIFPPPSPGCHFLCNSLFQGPFFLVVFFFFFLSLSLSLCFNPFSRLHSTLQKTRAHPVFSFGQAEALVSRGYCLLQRPAPRKGAEALENAEKLQARPDAPTPLARIRRGEGGVGFGLFGLFGLFGSLVSLVFGLWLVGWLVGWFFQGASF